MKNLLIFILLIVSVASFGLLNACKHDVEKDIIGKYRNTFEAGVNHFVELYKDSTFLHYYKKGNESKENKGKWRLSVRPEKTEIVFDTWIDFGYKDEPVCNQCLRMVKLKDGELIFNVDLPDEVNFKKEK